MSGSLYFSVVAKHKDSGEFTILKKYIGHGYNLMFGHDLPSEVATLKVPKEFQLELLKKNKYSTYMNVGAISNMAIAHIPRNQLPKENLGFTSKEIWDAKRVTVIPSTDYENNKQQFSTLPLHAEKDGEVEVLVHKYNTYGMTDYWFDINGWDERIKSLKEDILKNAKKLGEWEYVKNSFEYKKLSSKEKENIQCEYGDFTGMGYDDDGEVRYYDFDDDPDYDWDCIANIQNLLGAMLMFDPYSYDVYGCIYSSDNVMEYRDISDNYNEMDEERR